MKKWTRRAMQPEDMTQGDTQMCDVRSHKTTSSKDMGGKDAVHCQCGSKEDDDDMVRYSPMCRRHGR